MKNWMETSKKICPCPEPQNLLMPLGSSISANVISEGSWDVIILNKDGLKFSDSVTCREKCLEDKGRDWNNGAMGQEKPECLGTWKRQEGFSPRTSMALTSFDLGHLDYELKNNCLFCKSAQLLVIYDSDPSPPREAPSMFASIPNFSCFIKSKNDCIFSNFCKLTEPLLMGILLK